MTTMTDTRHAWAVNELARMRSEGREFVPDTVDALVAAWNEGGQDRYMQEFAERTRDKKLMRWEVLAIRDYVAALLRL